MGLRIEQLRGEAIATQLQALADLRIEVFREWPYLYEGTAEYEKRYLATYLRSPRSIAILAWDGESCVGASTAIPLADAEPAVQAPFRAAGMSLEAIDYFGESVILRPWRGRGLGVKFFELRERHARELGLSTCVFCSVVRPDGHPACPPAYVPNDAFWAKRGYHPAPRLQAEFEWPDSGQSIPTAKQMRFWMRDL